MTDQELSRLLTESLDERIARAESAPVDREVLKRMPSPEAAAVPELRAVPVRQARWKGALAAVLVMCVLGGAGLAAWKLSGKTDPNRPGNTAESGSVHTTEPSDDDRLPTAVYDEKTSTLRISGTEGYERLELPEGLYGARNLEVEDDDFHFTGVLYVMEDYTERSGVSLAEYLPGYLDRLDNSLAFVGQYIASVAPNEEIAERTRLRPELSALGSGNAGPDQIKVSLNSAFRHHGVAYALCLLDTKTVEWQQLGYAYWVGICKDPYNSIYAIGDFSEEADYYYFKDYFRVGGTPDPRNLDNQVLLMDACAWYCLVYGRDWNGNTAERGSISSVHNFNGSPNKPGNQMSLSMAVSLLNYLANEYGEEKLAAFCFDTCSFNEAFGTDFSAARSAWERALIARFGEGGEPGTDN